MPWESVFKLSCGIGEQDTCSLPTLYICCVILISRGIALLGGYFIRSHGKFKRESLIILYVLYNSYIIIVVALQKLSCSKSSTIFLRVLISLRETFACLAIKDNNFLNAFVFFFSKLWKWQVDDQSDRIIPYKETAKNEGTIFAVFYFPWLSYSVLRIMFTSFRLHRKVS